MLCISRRALLGSFSKPSYIWGVSCAACYFDAELACCACSGVSGASGGKIVSRR